MLLALIDEHGNFATKPNIEARYRTMNLEALEIMQFTGLLDIDGNELYEGDIVGHYVKDLDGQTIESFRSVIKWWPDMVDVRKARRIGNIYENPELLK